MDMQRHPTTLPAASVVLIGSLGLASAMGIGRFAFTPMLPLLQREAGLALDDGGWLAFANYAGYLVGALLCFAFDPRAGASARAGLAAVAACTLGAALAEAFAVLLALRFLAGVASALALVGVAAWALAGLAAREREDASGWVFGGVGLGIVAAGLVALVADGSRAPTAHAWLAMGGLAAFVAFLAWRPLGMTAGRPDVARRQPTPLGRAGWCMVFCYGAFGFGYIVPSTFLPAVGRSTFAESSLMAWTWPLFGLAAAASTAASARMFQRTSPAKVWALSQFIMAFGVILPVVVASPWSILVCAACVGGTFMVVTMAGLQQARIVAGAGASRLMAAMTAAFALGQLAGPLCIQPGVAGVAVIAAPSIAAAIVLAAGAAAMLRPITGSSQGRCRQCAMPDLTP